MSAPDARLPARRYGSAAERWAGLGPYYAMFPTWFADGIVREFSVEGDVVLDPFAGRGTALFSASSAGRLGIGAEVSRVGWIYAKTKLSPASHGRVRHRLAEIARRANTTPATRLAQLPGFFRACYAPDVLRFLVTARDQLDWRTSAVDRTLMAFVLVYLHGKAGSALSNQMRQTKAMAPDYSVRWWEERNHRPPDIDPVEFLTRRIAWRYRHGRPESGRGSILLGDSTRCLGRLEQFLRKRGLGPASLLLTSPPYFGVTNYHYDQWLRLWMLGGDPIPRWNQDPHRNRFENATAYRNLLLKVFSNAKKLLSTNAILYVRTSASTTSVDPLVDVLGQVFPDYALEVHERSYEGRSQTSLFTDASRRVIEVDVSGTRLSIRSRRQRRDADLAARSSRTTSRQEVVVESH